VPKLECTKILGQFHLKIAYEIMHWIQKYYHAGYIMSIPATGLGHTNARVLKANR
jgi:hypothetical protein